MHVGKDRKVTLSVDVFPPESLPCDGRVQALKVLEEASEVNTAWCEHERSGSRETLDGLGDEIADCIQACVNMARISGVDLDVALARVHLKNVERGRL